MKNPFKYVPLLFGSGFLLGFFFERREAFGEYAFRLNLVAGIIGVLLTAYIVDWFNDLGFKRRTKKLRAIGGKLILRQARMIENLYTEILRSKLTYSADDAKAILEKNLMTVPTTISFGYAPIGTPLYMYLQQTFISTRNNLNGLIYKYGAYLDGDLIESVEMFWEGAVPSAYLQLEDIMNFNKIIMGLNQMPETFCIKDIFSRREDEAIKTMKRHLDALRKMKEMAITSEV